MGTSQSVDGRAPIHIFASSDAWIEGAATRQLETVARLPGVTAVAAMPDLHPGKYGPVGCAILADVVRPELVGGDIGCGMALFRLDIPARKLGVETVAERLRVLGHPWEGDADARLAAAGLADAGFAGALGTIGGGNHFCEVQTVAEVLDADAVAATGLAAGDAVLLVHSGSRGLGTATLEDVLAGGLVALDPASDRGRAYLAAHDRAVAWARLNRAVIAERAARAIRADLTPVCDLPHNMVETTARGLLHRKGAAAADRGLVPVPGSRGTLSYLVAPTAAEQPDTLASLAHGAGRKYDRASMHGRAGAKRSDLARLGRNRFGGIVVCEDRNMLIEEAPEAYKSIEGVIGDLARFGLARPVATFRPLVTFKSVLREETRATKGHRGRGFVDKRDREGGR